MNYVLQDFWSSDNPSFRYFGFVRLLILFFFFTRLHTIDAQNQVLLSSDSIDYDKRKKELLIGTVGLYTGASAGLYFVWYKQYQQEAFHFFNDWGEWNNMDKFGHIYATYTQVYLMHKGAQWAGYKDQEAVNLSVIAALAFQNTFEIMDGFSSGWGFSIPDFTSNLIGTSSFYFQQKHWGEQRIKFKVSYWPLSYPTETITSDTGLFMTTLSKRADTLYGTNPFERALKDYNGQTYWLSFDIASFIHETPWPKWLNLALGYGSDNMYGAKHNSWEVNDENFIVDGTAYTRYKKFILALDYNLGKIKINNRVIKTLLDVLDVFKYPAPAIEYRTNNTWHFSLVFLH